MNFVKILKVILWIAKLIVSIGRSNELTGPDVPQPSRQQRRKLQRELKNKKEC